MTTRVLSDKGSVVFIGLHELSLEVAASLLRCGYSVLVFMTNGPLVTEFLTLGGVQCDNLEAVGADISALMLTVTYVEEARHKLTACKAVIQGLSKEVAVVLDTSILTSDVRSIEKCIGEVNGLAYIVDAYISKNMSEPSSRKIRVTISGNSESISGAKPFISSMSEELCIFEGEVGAASKVNMVDELLQGIHRVASIEAIALGVQAGIHPWIIFEIISNAAGSSKVFKLHVPEILRGQNNLPYLCNLTQNLGNTLEIGKQLPFPLPLVAAAHEQLKMGVSYGLESPADKPEMKVWESVYRVNISGPANADLYNPEELGRELVPRCHNVKKIGFIGLGAMGFGMATHLLNSKFIVKGFDVYEPVLTRFSNAGGLTGISPADVSKDVDVLIIMVANEAQAENVLYGSLGAVAALSPGATVILSSTVSPGFVGQLEKRLINEKNLHLVDAPVSGGVKRASNGTLTIIASGTDEALLSAGFIISALSEKLYVLKGGCGAASGVKMVNQLLAGVHIAAAAEAMAFGTGLGLDSNKLFQYILCSAGSSWMLENRVPHMLDNDFTPCSALNIFVKDLGIVCRESTLLNISLHVASVALQLFVAGSAAGWGQVDDAGVVKVYETLTGVRIGDTLPGLKKDEIFKSLPKEWSSDLLDDICKLNRSNQKMLVVLDDDPTGTQTVHGIEVLTEWSVTSLVEQFKIKPLCFFILTNSRSLSGAKASELIKEICSNLKTAAKAADNIGYTVVLRGDSTLRGHFPEEADAVTSVLGDMDAWIICPFFEQGGRFTIGNVHYVADSDRLIPAGETEFAKDAAFGYKSSNLCQWVEEKTNGRIPASSVTSISISLLRKGGPTAVCETLCHLPKGSTCIVNGASARDMAVFSAGMIQAEIKGKSFLCRTAASFVSSRIPIVPKVPMRPKDLGIGQERGGGLIVVGSFVPKTTKQVDMLKKLCGEKLRNIEVSVNKVSMKSLKEREEEITRVAEMANLFLGAKKDTMIVTSRELIIGNTASESLEINFRISSALVEIVKRIHSRPRYILAKGGITSSDLATKALKAKRAKVVGQAHPGIPLWVLEHESRYPGVPYIVFPGNVGDSNALAEVVNSWTFSPRVFSTKELLLDAAEATYAVGAFNVYNMEGVEAVVSAAEEENSPAILQIHPSALRVGGSSLVTCCISAARQASVPITVHFDHGTSKQDLINSIEMGFDSVMVDASHLPLEENISCTKFVTSIAHTKNMLVEAELGRLSGTEDDITIEDYEASLTDIIQAEQFIDDTGIDSLAVCVGNIHGKYPASGPKLKLDLLEALHALCSKKGVFLVLHGASGLPKELIKGCVSRGVRKFNVNTEVRKAYMDAISLPAKDLIHVLESAKQAMKAVVADKMRLFGSSGKAQRFW